MTCANGEENVLLVELLTVQFDGITAVNGFSAVVRGGEILGLIGPNGAGKTTLFNLITGFVPHGSGSVRTKDRELLGLRPHRVARLGLTRTFQEVRLLNELTVLDNVMLAFPNQPGERLFNMFFRPRACWKQEEENRRAGISLLEFSGLAEKANDSAESLSYGQQKLLSLVCCLAAGAKLLLLDEPVAGIAPAMIEKILDMIRKLPADGRSVIFIEHNLDAVMAICDRVIFMDAGEKVSEGTPEEVRTDPRVIEAYID